MRADITDLIVDFHQALFMRVFLDPFRASIPGRLKLNEAHRQVEECADAAASG